MPKYWLEDGGVRLELVTPNQIFTATIPTASGSISFVKEYFYNTTNLDGDIVDRFKGYRVIVNVDNIINADTDEDIILKDVLNIINNIGRTGSVLNVIPKYGTTAGRHNHVFTDMKITSDINIQEPERFMCYQTLSLSFASKKLIQIIPTQFTQAIPTPTFVHWQMGGINIYTY